MAINVETNRTVDRALSEDRARYLEAFAERLFARQPSSLTGRLKPEERLHIAESAFQFFYIRKTEIKLRVTSGLDGDGVTIVQSAMPDCPFIVDSVLEYFHTEGAPIRMLLHPVFTVARDESGRLSSFEQGADGERRESLFHAGIEQSATPEECDGMAGELERVLQDVRLATGDFERMTARAMAIREEISAVHELIETRDFLRWLVYGGLVFLGYRRYRVLNSDGEAILQAEPESALGIMRSAAHRSRFLEPRPIRLLEESQRRLIFDGPALFINKTRQQSRVHRRSAMDDITIRRVSSDGEITFDRFLGLFTSKAYSEEAQHIPVLRAKLGDVLAAARATPGSHDFKEIVSAFNSFPKEELFRASVDELRNQLNLVLDLRSESAVRLSLNADPERGHVIALVLVPRERFSAEVRMRIQAALSESLGGPLVYYYLALGDSYTARLHFCFSAPPPKPALAPILERDIARLARTWRDRLEDELIERFGARQGAQIARTWSDAFSADYQASAGVDRAIADIEVVEQMLERGGGAEVTLSADEESGVAELRMYELGEAPLLSNLMPVLQNFGLQVISESAYEFQPETGKERGRSPFAQAFRVAGIRQETFENGGAPLIAEALKAVISGAADDDPLNTLSVSVGLSAREVALLRAHMAAAFQMRLAPARPTLDRAMLLHPELARLLVELFTARLDPDRETDRDAIERLHGKYIELLGAVDNIEEDRIARMLLSLIDATARTNYFCTPAPAYIALKFESGKIPSLGDGASLYEIHVNSPRMEGCHLRAGKIARGGIRYSDRPEDYRTEILDLMKTQTVKNAIIVPVGSKGGFIIKPRLSGALTHQDVVEAYQTLINAMLDLTDNLSDGGVVRPAQVKALDSDGAYLVVAADKGTASFSDIANGIAERRGFWLGDAFASGGKHGYDHKALGITARGAWESARWHLREMGRDLKSGAPITIVGIGDMSGDVFGNGLLQSENVKLVAAFDHRHIFIDPDPDPAISYAERRRLFDLPNSKWSDYDPALISRGGGVFKRGQKSITLSPEARAALGCDKETLDSDSLIRAILRADADMLYNGGIGTYVRASGETDLQVGDHANDNCRIAANELRARIVVEGGNLGFTQRARIEYALAGGRINTDAIDNSAGVDTSDHEVNLKILLRPMLASGALSLEERNRSLAECAAEVAERVLQDNRDQVLSLSLEQVRSRGAAEIYREHFVAIEQRGLLRRHEEAFPTAEELRERRAAYSGLTRPELAVVTAYTKIDLVARLEDSPFIDDPYLIDAFLTPYFPGTIVGCFADQIPRHRLRRELAACRIVNQLVDLMGSIFVYRLTRDFDVEVDQAVRSWVIADGVLGLRGRAGRLRGAAGEFTADAEMGALFALGRAARRACTWTFSGCDADAPIGEIVSRYQSAFENLANRFEAMLSGGERNRFERVYRELRAMVHQEEIAHDLTRLAFANHLLNILSLSLARATAADDIAAAYFGLGREIDFALIETALDSIDGDQWERRAAQELALELDEARTELCCAALQQPGADTTAKASRLIRNCPREFAAAERVLTELRTLPRIEVPALQVAIRALTRLAHASRDSAA